MPKFMTITASMLITALTHAGDPQAVEIPVQPSDFNIVCALVNPDTGQTLTSIIPGELARATATIKVGASVMAKSVAVVATASVSLHGFNMNMNIGESTLNIPSVEEREELIALYSSRDEPPPTEFGRRFIADFKLPNEWPRSLVKVRLTARIPEVGSKTCSKTIEVI